MKKKIKVGVLINSEAVRGFEYEILKDLSLLDLCDVVIYDVKSYIQQQRNMLLDIYLKFDTLLNARGKNHMLNRSIKDLDIDIKSNISFENGYEFDLLINLADQKVSDKFSSLSKYGIWELSYSHSQRDVNIAGILEVFEGSNTTVIALNKLPGKGTNGYMIDKIVCATHDLSPVKNRSDVVLKSSVMLVRNIENFLKNREAFLESKSKSLYFYKDKEFYRPKFLETFLSVSKLFCKNITSRFDKLFRKQQWSIYFAINDKNSDFNQNMSNFKEIPTPKEFFWADPFVIDKDEKSYIFFEEYVYKTHKGHLSVIEYDHDSGIFSESKEILNTNYHLSYPFIMEYDGDIYMIPEGSKDRDIKLYRAKNFPFEWEVVKTLLDDIVAVDTTLFYHEDRWWMFVNLAQKDGVSLNDELYIYYCDDFLKDNWTPHTQNPVISSLQTSRPAGNIIKYKEDYYRPSQNSVGWYGRSTNFNKIVKLTADEYKEEFVSEIVPEMIDGIYAVHTYNSSKKLTVVDGLKKIRRFF
jgi:hypothetical protein